VKTTWVYSNCLLALITVTCFLLIIWQLSLGFSEYPKFGFGNLEEKWEMVVSQTLNPITRKAETGGGGGSLRVPGHPMLQSQKLVRGMANSVTSFKLLFKFVIINNTHLSVWDGWYL
jgi:hypothetical protein